MSDAYSRRRARTSAGLHVAEQLELFSEPTEDSEQLRANTERRVAFHTADLTPHERSVIESSLLESRIEVCFATSTLAAGVNFPFKSVLFPKLTYQWPPREGMLIPRNDYRNVSGRAGRLGMHEEGFAVLLPRNDWELQHAKEIVLPENDKVESQIVGLSMRRAVLMLVASGIVKEKDNLRGFFENTLYWHMAREKNPARLDTIIGTAMEATDWIVDAGLVERHDAALLATPLGKATAISGLLPITATSFVAMLRASSKALEADFDGLATGILHWICSSEEFQSETPSRFLPWPSGGESQDSVPFVSSRKLLKQLDRTDTRLVQNVHALALYIGGLEERKIRFATNIASGQLHRLAIDVSWLIDGLHKIACVPDVGMSRQFANRLAMLSRRVRWGAPAEALDIIRVAERHGVPGLGRQRAMALLKNGLSTFIDIIGCDKKRLAKVLRSERRAVSLLEALSAVVGPSPNRLASSHTTLARKLGIEQIVETCNSELGTAYEEAIIRLLEVEDEWSVQRLDDGRRQNVPDILITLAGTAVLVECKTTTKSPPLIAKEEAFAILQKAADFEDEMRRVTLGKPSFDEHSKVKALAASAITLVEHPIFMEGLLRVHAGAIKPREFLTWLSEPGVAELEQLAGRSTHVIA